MGCHGNMATTFQEEEGVPPPGAELLARLAGLKKSELKKRARSAGVTQDELDQADDVEDERAAVVELIMAHEMLPAYHNAKVKTALRAELEDMKRTGRKKRALAAGQ